MSQKTFADCERSKYWSTRNEITPDKVPFTSSKKYWFFCPICEHEFEQSISKITLMGRGCRFCTNQKRCYSIYFILCFYRSFASHEKAIYWAPSNGDVKPRDVAKYANIPKYNFRCDRCPHEFSASLNNISQGKWCPYCSGRLKCENEDCTYCFERSFASHPKAKFWSSKNVELPRMIALNTQVLYWFTCKEGHEFQCSPMSINGNNRWCQVCSGRAQSTRHKRCVQGDVCQKCYDTSFATHAKAQFWSPLNENTKPQHVTVTNSNRFLFECGECHHDFKASLSEIVKDEKWCPQCSNLKVVHLCKNSQCNSCLKRSFSSHEKSKFWSTKNALTPRDITIFSQTKFIFDCNDCGHEISTSPYSIHRGHWCSYCSHIERCLDADCKFCFVHSFASHPFSQFWSDTRTTPREVSLHCKIKYEFTCSDCKKTFMTNPTSVTYNGTGCPFCQYKTEQLLLNWLHEWFKKNEVVR